MNPSDKIKVMVVDDHPLLRVGITAIVNARSDMAVVAQAETDEEAVAMFPRCKPDVTLMDLKLPGMYGVATITAIRAGHPGARFIVVTTYEGDEDIHRALEAGAQGYIIKGMPYQVLVQALQRVSACGRFLPPPVAHALASRIPDSELSACELEVLNLLVAGKSNKDIALSLGITEATVKKLCQRYSHAAQRGRSHSGGRHSSAAGPSPFVAEARTGFSLSSHAHQCCGD